jgi:hypothetical protein
MATVEVAKLRLRCDARHRDRARFAIEDGMRTAIPDDRRLVLLRTMRIGGQAGSDNPAQRQAAVRDGWLAAIAGARHGGEDGAGGANCVWFASREEAETLLLTRLLSGRSIDAWYWRLALPDWRGRPLRDWLPECLSEALAKGEDRRLLAIARACVAAGVTEKLVEALADSGAIRAAPTIARAAGEAAASASALHRDGGVFLERVETGRAATPMAVPAGLRSSIARLMRAGGEARAVAQAVVRAWALRQSPALALSPDLFASVVAATVEDAISARAVEPSRIDRADQRPASQGSTQTAKSPEQPRPARTRQTGGEVRSQPPSRARAPPEGRPPAQPAPEHATPQDPRVAQRRQHSRHAGLWLVVPSLVELGFREWLTERPALLRENPGGRLLQAIARHHRVPADDPALVVLGDPPEPDALPIWTALWRHGLDRWLRRTVRRRLYDLVNRPGELACGELRLDVHYPAADADLALRRRALDRDPGWTDWLGLSIRYHFGGAEDWL